MIEIISHILSLCSAGIVYQIIPKKLNKPFLVCLFDFRHESNILCINSTSMITGPTIIIRNYRDNCENGIVPVAISNVSKTLLKDYVLRFNIISFHYIFIRLPTSILGLMSRVTIITRMETQSSVWFLFRSCFSVLRLKINNFRIHKKCYFSGKICH